MVREFAVDFTPPPAGRTGGTGLYAGDRDLFAFLIGPAGRVEIAGEAFAPRLFVWSSEVGHRALGVQTFWFQQVCRTPLQTEEQTMANTKSAPTRPPEAATPGPKSEPTPSGDRPVHEMRLGRVRCSVWRSESDTGPWYSVKPTRLYKVGAEWKASGGLNRDDLRPAAKLCEEVALWLFHQQQCPAAVGDGNAESAPGDDIPF